MPLESTVARFSQSLGVFAFIGRYVFLSLSVCKIILTLCNRETLLFYQSSNFFCMKYKTCDKYEIYLHGTMINYYNKLGL